MATPIRQLCRVIFPELKNYCGLSPRGNLSRIGISAASTNCNVLYGGLTLLQIRNTSFFVRLPAEQIWKGVTSVSNAGKKRGRGKGVGRITAKNLNRGQIIGIGEENMVWPGLNSPILRGKEIVEMKQLPPNPEYKAKLNKIRDEMTKFRLLKLTSLERGYSGNKMPGRSIGPPDQIGDDSFESFDTRVVEFKTVTNMSGTAGRKKRISTYVVTGNKNGLAGYSIGKAPEGRAALRKAKNAAIKKLVYIERFNDHTVYHNFYAKYGRTKIFVHKKPKGYGLVCHRVIKTICEVIGIKDLYAKVEGNTKNIKNVTRAFFHGLLHQKTHQKVADETGLHIIELRKETDDLPVVIAKPQVPTTEIPQTTATLPQYTEYISEGRVALKKKKHPQFYKKLPGWQHYLRKTQFRRNHDNVKIQMMADYGAIKSFLSEKDVKDLPVIKGVAAYK